MKNILVYFALCFACGGAWAQSASSTAQSSSAAQSGAVASGGNVAVYLGGDPSGSSPDGQGSVPAQHIKEDIKTVGNPGAASYGVSFSQFNCANTAAVGAGWLGGVFQLGGAVESTPCNDRANASALFQIAGALAPSNAVLSSQLYHAAILLIGNSTSETRKALEQAGAADWVQPVATQDSALAPRDFNPPDLYHHP